LVSGEPGIGKSRLLEALIETIGLPAESCLRFQCDPLHRDTPFHPFLQQLSKSFGLAAADELTDRRRKIVDAVGLLFHDAGETVDRLVGLFAPPERHVDEAESPAIRRQRTIEALVEYIVRQAEKQPAIILVEDIQWTDPTTEHVLSLIVRRLNAHPILLAATSRDQFPAGWFAGPHVIAVPLAKLDRQASAQLVRNTGSESLDESMVLRIADSADGIPLFLEEMTKYVIEEGGSLSAKLVERGAVALPISLQASLNSRLDRLGSAKRVAQVGAVVGREFKASLLAEVIGCEPKELRPELERLLDSGLIYDDLDGADSTLGYKHALMHEAAFSSLLLSERKRLHSRVLDAYEKRVAQPHDEFAQVLAQHAIQSERWEKAALYLGLAYSNAINRSANREAISLFNRAIEVIGKLPQQVGAPQAIDLLLQASTAFHTVGDNDKLFELIEEAQRLAQLIGDRRRSAAASVQTAFALWMQGKHPEAQERAQAALALTQLPKDFSIVVSALFNLGNIHHAQGNVAQAVSFHRQVLSMLQGGQENKRLGWAAAPSVFARAFASWYLVELGEFEEAAQLLRKGEPYIEPKQPHGRVMLDTGRGNLLMRRGDFGPAVDVFAPTLDLCQRAEVLTMLPMVSSWFGRALCGAGRVEEALQMLGYAVDRQTYKYGGKYTWIHLRLALAEAYRLDGQLERAASEAELALRIADECGEIVHHSYAMLELGRIALDRRDPSLALLNAEAALCEARPRGLRPFVAECLCLKAKAYDALHEASAQAAATGEARRLISQLGLDARRLPALQVTTA
jgi:tetratricopeptide (TPR) repeat protein